jgi:hypothetical protein
MYVNVSVCISVQEAAAKKFAMKDKQADIGRVVRNLLNNNHYFSLERLLVNFIFAA